MNKKIILASLLCVGALVGCGGGDKPSSTEPSTPATSVVTPTTSEQAPETSEAPVEFETTTKTIDELVASVPTTNMDTIYVVEGIWDPDSGKNEYGNGYLVDPVSKKQLKIYGLSKDNSCLSLKEGTYEYNNEKTYQSLVTGDTKKMAPGDKVKLGMVYNSNYKNYSAYFVEKLAEASTFTYELTLTSGENGTATLSATSGVYDTLVTLNATPAEGFQVDAVKVNGEIVPAASDNVYKFNIGVGKQEVTISFKTAQSLVGQTIAYDFTKVNTGTSTLDASSLLTIFSEAKDQLDVVASVSDLNKVYGANDAQGPKLKGVKLGTSSTAGTFKITTAEAVKTIKITCAAWNAESNDKLQVNDLEAQKSSASGATELTFTFETLTKEITIKAINRAVITSITFVC